MSRNLPEGLLDRVAGAERKLTPEPGVLTVPITLAPWLFGGGAKTRESDPLTRVRPTSVLGGVQACWRLLTDARDADDLRAREEAIFGGAGRPAVFRLAVTGQRPGKEVVAPRMGDPGGYLAFPAREERTTGVAAMTLWSDVGATLRFSPARAGGALPDELRRAIELWLLLGGVGGRTRRGLGAVQATAGELVVAGAADLDRRLQRLLGPAPRGAKCGGVRSVRAVWRTEGVFPDALTCLKALEAWYKGYRQHRRLPKEGRPGRSYWDEPEQLRRITRSREPRHTPLEPHSAHPKGFARAALGLPIVFHFKDRADPPQSMLVAAKSDRMASPLWFRPVAVGREQWVGVVAQLSGPYHKDNTLRLKWGRGEEPVPITPEIDRVFRDLVATPVAGKALRPVVGEG